ncbi:hypothetical protein Poly24_36780 [Rosistilla carotiformis]|uniref:Carboxypeptidase regulatory-like domain-containing protein n=1 Tax=Rosistilla carotiformis TaxID=2528017 RepID=A0A518JWP8_9BACT|nr:carboxypeptidase-like regulatory domain-containing protein [Rosistilla carotiformis]QDV69959.1 hypothetical protein Poly24_36780 [Rosistilla carotiformis]
MSESASEVNATAPETAAANPPRWRSGPILHGPSRYRQLAIGSCLLATLMGTILAFASLPSPNHRTVLVSLYLQPDDEALGVDAPHPPTDELFLGLVPANAPLQGVANVVESEGDEETAKPDADASGTPTATKNAKDPDAKSGGTDAKAEAAKSADASAGQAASENAPPKKRNASKPGKSWRDALVQTDSRQQVVLHVSTLARIDQGQVYFYGVDPKTEQNVAISLVDVLAQLEKSPAEKKLLILEVHWPIVSDEGDSQQRLQLLNRAIKEQLSLHEIGDTHVLLSASDQGPARGLRAAPQSLMSYCLTQSLCDAAADCDHDGRVSLKEAVDWAAPLIASASLQAGPEQRIEWIPGESNVCFSPITATIDSAHREYPAALTAGWRLREMYLANTELPWLPETGRRWAQSLSQIESGWRRGENENNVASAVARIQVECLAEIDNALATRAQTRPDSLRLAAARMLSDREATEIEARAKTLMTEHQKITATIPAAEQAAAIGKAVAKYTAAFASDQAAVALEAVVAQFDRSVRIDRDSLELLAAVRNAWKTPPTFPITQAIDRLRMSQANDQQIATALRMFRIHGRLGSDPAAIAILSPRINDVTNAFVVAQRLAWNSGMTLDSEVTRQLDSALVMSGTALAAEESVGLAIRRLKVASQTIATDAAVGVHWDHDRDYLLAQRRAADLIGAIGKLRRGTIQGAGILTGELAVLRQASEALDRQLKQMTQSHSDQITNSEASTSGLISTTIPASVRSQILNQPIEYSFGPEYRAANQSATLASAMSSVDAMSDQPQICLQTLSQQAEAIAKASASRYLSWLNDYVAQTATIDAIPIYRSIAQQRSIARSDAMIPVAIRGGLGDLTWDTPTAQIALHYQVDVMDAVPVTYEFFASAGNCIAVVPPRGTLKADQIDQIQFDLTPSDVAQVDPFVGGIWLQLTRGTQTELIPLKMPKQPIRPPVEIDFGPAASSRGRDVRLALWPDNQPQALAWQLICHDPSIASIVVSVSSPSLGTLTTAPIPCQRDVATPIRFLPAEPTTKKSPAGSQTSRDPSLLLTATEPKSGAVLGRWRIATEVLDPREAFKLGPAEYRVRPHGDNELSVDVLRNQMRLEGSDPSLPEPTFRLELDSTAIAPLIDFGDSRLQSQLAAEQSRCQLFAHNLRFDEGREPEVSLPVSINGDPGYFALSGRFPRQSSRVRLQAQRTPTIDVSAVDAIVPGQPILATLKARQLADADGLTIEVLSSDGGQEVLWRTDVPTSRSIDAKFAGGGTQATLQVVAKRSDWQLPIPTHFGTGVHRLRVTTTDPIGNQKVTGTHRFLLDDALPDEIHARGESISDQMTVLIHLRRNPSGVASVSVLPVVATTDTKVKPIKADRLGDGDETWQLAWPKALPVPEQIELTITTNAGKTGSNVVALPVQVIEPIGRIAGRVLEGSIAQPGLTVSLTDAKGKPVSKIETATDGSYTFSVPPGKYNLEVKKPATQRSAKAEVEAKLQTTTTTDLSLLRS